MQGDSKMMKHKDGNRLLDAMEQANQARIAYEDACVDVVMAVPYDLTKMIRDGKRRLRALDAQAEERENG